MVFILLYIDCSLPYLLDLPESLWKANSLSVHNELGKVKKFGTAKPFSWWRNSHQKKVRVQLTPALTIRVNNKFMWNKHLYKKLYRKCCTFPVYKVYFYILWWKHISFEWFLFSYKVGKKASHHFWWTWETLSDRVNLELNIKLYCFKWICKSDKYLSNVVILETPSLHYFIFITKFEL